MGAYSITSDCIGCTLCARNCPVKAITGERKQQHFIDRNICIRCGLCGKLCAKGAVRDPEGNPTERIAKADWLSPVIDPDECAGCSLCIVNCPKGCLALTEPAFFGDTHTLAQLANPKDCIGCGLCANACPIDAIHLEKPSETKEEIQ